MTRAIVGLWGIGIGLVSIAVMGAQPKSKPAPAEKQQLAIRGQVVDSDGVGVAGAEVVCDPTSSSNGNEFVESKTDEKGQFDLAVPSSGEKAALGVLWAKAPNHRVTGVAFSPTGVVPQSIRVVLPHASNLRVKVENPLGEPASGVRVTVGQAVFNIPIFTKDGMVVQQVNMPASLLARCWVTTDAEGFAALPDFTEPQVGQFQFEHPDFGRQGRSSEASRTEGDALVFQFIPVGRIRGRIVADDLSQVRGRRVVARTSPSDSRVAQAALAEAITDAQGAFEIPALAQGDLDIALPDFEVPRWERHPQEMPNARRTPEPKENNWLPAAIPPKKLLAGEVFEVEIRLCPKVRIHGQLIDARTDKPIQGDVKYSVQQGGPSWGVRDHGLVRTDASGRFQFYGVSNASVEVRPEGKIAGVAVCVGGRWETVPPGTQDFPLQPLRIVRVPGRVVCEDGQGIADAHVMVSWYEREPDGREFPVSQGAEFTTDSEGGYEAWMEPGGTYRLTGVKEVFELRESPWAQLPSDVPTTLPNLVLAARATIGPTSRDLKGRVVDRQGQPVPDAHVFHTSRAMRNKLASSSGGKATTDPQGEFHLMGVPAGQGLVFVESEGYRFHGEWIAPDVQRVEIALARADEAPLRTLKSLPPMVSCEERHSLARKLLQPYVKRLRETPSEASRARGVLSLMVAVDHPEIEQLWNDGVLQDPMARQTVEKYLTPWKAYSRKLVRTCWEQSETPFERGGLWFALNDVVPDYAWPLRVAAVVRGTVHARTIADPSERMHLLGQAAERFADLGLTGSARLVMEEALESGKCARKSEMPDLWCDFASRLARIDPPEALAALDGVNKAAQVHAIGDMAMVLSCHDPRSTEEAIRTLCNRSRIDWVIDPACVVVCGRMARTDLASARRIAANISDPRIRAWARAVMAREAAHREPGEARAMVLEAYASLESLVDNERDKKVCCCDAPAAAVAAAALSAVEVAAPDLLDEMLWRSVAMRPLPSEPPPLMDKSSVALRAKMSDSDHADARLAALVSRYDRHAASSLEASAMAAIPNRHEVLVASSLAVLDVKKLEEVIETASLDSARGQIDYGALQVLAATDAKIWDTFQTAVLALKGASGQDLDKYDHPLPVRWFPRDGSVPGDRRH